MRCPLWLILGALLISSPTEARKRLPPPDAATPLPTWPRRPDPKPLTTTHYLDLTVRYVRGAAKVIRVRRGRFPAGPTKLKRFRGRFEVQLYVHAQLLDVVRFDLPLTGTAEPAATAGAPGADPLGQRLADGVSATLVVRAPFSHRVTRALLVDTRSGRSQPIDLRRFLAPQPRPQVPGDLRTRAFGSSGSAPPPPRTKARRHKRSVRISTPPTR